MLELFQVLGGIAGFGGVALGVLYLLYRDLMRDIIRNRMFRALTAAQATALFGAVVVLAFVVAVLGVFATLAESKGVVQFLVLVAMLLLFLLAILLVGARVAMGRRPARAGAADRSLTAVRRHVERDEPDEAERALEVSRSDRDAAEFWYWKARIALVRSNVDVASGYVDEALKLEPRDPYGIALKTELLLLANDPARCTEAERLAASATGLSAELDTWLRRLRAEGMFGGGVRTRTRLEARCPLPTPSTERAHAE